MKIITIEEEAWDQLNNRITAIADYLKRLEVTNYDDLWLNNHEVCQYPVSYTHLDVYKRQGKMYYSYFSGQLANLKREYIEHLCNSDFYRYYRSGRTDRDDNYFKRGNINYHDGLNSIVFEIDSEFSTFFDYKTARIISNDLLYTYPVSYTHLDVYKRQQLHQR